MGDGVILRCTRCGATLRLFVYDEHGTIHHWVQKRKEWQGFLNAHAIHHPAWRENGRDLGDDPGFEVITLNQLMHERGASHDPAVRVNE